MAQPTFCGNRSAAGTGDEVGLISALVLVSDRSDVLRPRRQNLLNDFEIHIGREITPITGLAEDSANPCVPVFEAGVPVRLAEIRIVRERGI